MKRQNDALKRARDQNVADLQSEVVRTKALLEQSTKNLNDALSRQADVRKEFADLVKGIQATPTSGTQTFGDATAAQASARNALTAGNNQKAIEEARRALQILQQLKDAGANSYGFEGVAKEVERIANKAAEVEAGNAKAADDVNRLNLADLEERIAAVQNVEVSFGMDFESAETLKQQVADIAAGLAEQLVIPITLVPPPEMGLPGVPSITPKIPGFATGTQALPWHGLGWGAWAGVDDDARRRAHLQRGAVAADVAEVSTNSPRDTRDSDRGASAGESAGRHAKPGFADPQPGRRRCRFHRFRDTRHAPRYTQGRLEVRADTPKMTEPA